MAKSGDPVIFFNAVLAPGPPTDPAQALLCEGADKIVLTMTHVYVGAGASAVYYDVYFDWTAPVAQTITSGSSVTVDPPDVAGKVSGVSTTLTAPAPADVAATTWHGGMFVDHNTTSFQNKHYGGNQDGSATTRDIYIAPEPNGTFKYYVVIDNPGAVSFKVKLSYQGIGSCTATTTARAIYK